MTTSTLDELIAGFPHSSLPKVTGEPTCEELNVIRRLLNTNAMSVASYEGGGRHGHPGIIMTNDEYFAIAVDVFPVPNNPGPLAAVVAGITTAVLIPQVRMAHKYPNSHWETIQPPGGDNAECVFPHKVYTAVRNKSLTATYQCKTPIPSNKLLVNKIVNNN
jgi:hypothetical protein